MFARRLGASSTASVAGDKAIPASGLRRPRSRTQAISDRVRLPPAESPAMTRKAAGAGPSGPLSRIQR
jgi:hypothetical protein